MNYQVRQNYCLSLWVFYCFNKNFSFCEYPAFDRLVQNCICLHLVIHPPHPQLTLGMRIQTKVDKKILRPT